MVFQVGYVTVVPALSGPSRVTEANGLLYAAQSAAAVAGPLLAGLVSALLGPAGAIAIDAGSFAVSAVGVLVVRKQLSSRRAGMTDSVAPAGPVSPGCSATPCETATPGASGVATLDGPVSGRPDKAGPWQELLAGARFLWQQPVLRALTVLLTLYIFATQGLPDVLIYYLKHGLGQGDGVVGLVLAVAALGTVAGALAVAPLRRRLGFGTCWTGAVLLSGLAIAGLGASGSVPAVAVLAALYLGCGGVAGICSMSVRQEITPEHLLGRVTAAFWTIHFSLGPAGAALLTWAAGHFGVLAACVASGAACLLIAAIALATPIMRSARRPMQMQPET
jgi:MFS family permease